MSVILNTASEIGDQIIIEAVQSASGAVTLSSYTDTTGFETAFRFWTKEYRYSTDNRVSFSAWKSLDTQLNGEEIFPTAGFIWYEFKYTRSGTDTTGVLTVSNISLTGAQTRSFLDRLISQAKALYPTGYAFKIGLNSIREKIEKANARSANRALIDGYGILNSILPDNEFFTEQDAENWEKRLGLPTNSNVSLDDRKSAILRKYQHPGTVLARGSYRSIERELQLAGFDVYVHENRFPDGSGGWESRTYADVVGITGLANYGNFQYGQVQYGQQSENLIVNSMDAAVDNTFDYNGNLERTFFIGGATVGDFANVPIARQQEFRQLVLTLKPVQTVCFQLINFV